MEDWEDLLPQQGERFHGYVVEKLLGRGGLGAVYLVRHEVLDTLYALKVLYPGASDASETSVKRFLREARLATRIRHPNLVAVHDCGCDPGTNLYYLVMDYVSGSTLRNMLAFEGKLDIRRAADIVAQVASALRAAQPFKVVHRDIKPENIMVQPNGLVKIVDLGIAKAQNLGDSLKTNTESFFGTPCYVSPEQAHCAADVDARADIYSLGIVFYEMLAGKGPYAAKNPALVLAQILSDEDTPDIRDDVKDIDPGVAVLIRRMTTKDRERRLGSFDAVLGELARLGLGGRAGDLPVTEVSSRPEVGMKTLLESAGRDTGGKPLELEKDAEVQDFLEKRRRQRARRRRLAFFAAAGVIVALLLALALCQG